MPGIEPSKGSQLQRSSSARLASALPQDWSDQDFCEAFESLEIPKEMFHHREHIRLAWIYSHHFSEEQALARIVQGIQAFAKHHGVTDKYHHTITVAWMRLVWHAAGQTALAPDFNTFAAARSHLLNSRLLGDYYSTARLQSDAARHTWMEPDLCLLP